MTHPSLNLGFALIHCADSCLFLIVVVLQRLRACSSLFSKMYPSINATHPSVILSRSNDSIWILTKRAYFGQTRL